jgi:dihydrolipoamide dehydrogenase
MKKKIIIIGGGPGGYVAAIRSAQLGAEPILIEKNRLGGTCLNWGCIPTKALYRNAEILNNLKEAESFGIKTGAVELDMGRVIERKNEIVEKVVSGVEKLIQANKIQLIKGTARLVDGKTVEVSTGEGHPYLISGDAIVIATGSKAVKPPVEGANLEGILGSKSILDLTEVPRRLAVVGGGVIGLEFAGIFNAFGSEVTLTTRQSKLLRKYDSDISKRLPSILKRSGMTVMTKTTAKKIEKRDGIFFVTLEGKKGEMVLEADAVLLSGGRKPYTDELGLEESGVEFDRKGISVDESFMTNLDGVYAIGDVNGKVMLAHAASYQGVRVVEEIMGLESTVNTDLVPECVFIFPEVAVAGLSEDEAVEKGIEFKTGKFLFAASGKAQSLGETDGFVKVVLDSQDRLIGIHVIGPHASDLMHEGLLGINAGLTIEDVARTIHAHPTLSEAFSEAVLDAGGMAIHKLGKK